MPLNRLEMMMGVQEERRRGRLLPYFTAGFPALDVTEELIRRVDALGVRAVEIGVPYSDSIADGPVIQSSYQAALERGFRVSDLFRLAERLRPDVRCAMLAMVSYSIVHRMGLVEFMNRTAGVGLDGVIIPDLPYEESEAVAREAVRAGLCHIGFVAPTTSPSRRQAIVQRSTGFLYQLAVAGTTGERAALPVELAEQVAELHRISRLPVVVGFGIGTVEQVRQVCAFADGAIVGSAIIRRMNEALDAGYDHRKIVDSVVKLVREWMDAR